VMLVVGANAVVYGETARSSWNVVRCRIQRRTIVRISQGIRWPERNAVRRSAKGSESKVSHSHTTRTSQPLAFSRRSLRASLSTFCSNLLAQ